MEIKKIINSKFLLIIIFILVLILIGENLFLRFQKKMDVLSLSYLASEHLKKSNYDYVIIYANQAIGIDPEFFYPYMLLGFAYRNLGKDELAISTFKKALELMGKKSKTYNFFSKESLEYDSQNLREILEELERSK